MNFFVSIEKRKTNKTRKKHIKSEAALCCFFIGVLALFSSFTKIIHWVSRDKKKKKSIV
jgi:hypothetical protein